VKTNHSKEVKRVTYVSEQVSRTTSARHEVTKCIHISFDHWIHLSFQENVLLRKDLESKEDDKKGKVDIPPDTCGTIFTGQSY